MRLRLWLALFLIVPAAYGSVPCYQLVGVAGAVARRTVAQPAALDAFARAAFQATQELARVVEISLVPSLEAFPPEQRVDQIGLEHLSADPAAARAAVLASFSLIGRAAPKPPEKSVALPRNILSRLFARTTAPRVVPVLTIPEPNLPSGYQPLPILIQGRESILRALEEWEVALQITPAQTANWWTAFTVGGVVAWPFGVWRGVHALIDEWAYEHVPYSSFATAVRDALALGSPPAGAPLNFLVGVRNPAVSFQLVFHWNENSAPVLLGSYADAPE